MAIFVGTEEEFNTYIGPRMRNLVNSMTKSLRQEVGNVCEHCGKTFSSLDAAHVNGKGRKDLVAQTLREYEQDGLYVIPSLDEFEKKFKEAHEPIRDTFLFLCRDCHRKYDSQQSTEEQGTTPIDSQPNTRVSYPEKSHLESEPGTPNACQDDIGEHPRDRESFQDFVRRTLKKLFANGMITDNELARLQQKEYSKRTFGLAFPLIVEGLSNTEVSGHGRYWKEPIYKDYYACSQWWKQNIPVHEEKFAAWVQAMKRVSGRNAPQ